MTVDLTSLFSPPSLIPVTSSVGFSAFSFTQKLRTDESGSCRTTAIQCRRVSAERQRRQSQAVYVGSHIRVDSKPILLAEHSLPNLCQL